MKFKVIRKSLNRQNQEMTLKHGMTFGLFQETFIYRHHAEPRAQLYVPKEETFPVPLKYIDVTRSTHTNLDFMQEQRIDDCWNVDENRSLSDSWIGVKNFTLLKEEPPKGHMW